MLRQEAIANDIDAQWTEFQKEDTGFECEILRQISAYR
jgi:hypothetical protein